MANELKLERQTWHELECAANNAGGIEVAMVSLPIEKVKALVAGRTRPAAPVEGLVRYRIWFDNNYNEIVDEEVDGEYVRYKQAEAIIAAKDADNAALTARVKELEEEIACLRTEKHADAEYAGHLETQLAAVRKALEAVEDHSIRCEALSSHSSTAMAYLKDIQQEARAALEAKP